MSEHVEKVFALQVALSLNAPGPDRTFIVELLSQAYQNEQMLRLDQLGHQLKFLTLSKEKHRLGDITHFMTCLRLECLSQQ
jgi:hypothetical protein